MRGEKVSVVDSLEIQISAQARTASASLDALNSKLDRLSSNLSRASNSGIPSLAHGVSGLANSMMNMKNVNAADFTRLAKNMERLTSIDTSKIRGLSVAFSGMAKSLSGMASVPISDNATKISQLAKGIAQLGYKSSTQAIKNIPLLASAMEDLINRMSRLPQVSKNLILFTNALAKLSRTGASSGKAATSISKSLDSFSNSTVRARKNTFSLAAAIGKVYATYWMLFRAFRILKKAIDISSNLTEVQNIVDVTFGKYSNLVEKMSETSITEFGMSELTVKQVSSRFQAMGTAMGFTQRKMADMSIELTKLTADMASFYNVEQSAVAEDLASIFTGQTRPLRQYGLDLTEATLREWAMKNGLDANIKSMTQAEKTMLRYQYVMANTGAAQGDFLRTSNTWANQTRILKQNLEQLGAVVGGTFINAFKPLVSTLNVIIAKFTQFAQAVSNSLGKIFGWTYEGSTGGGLVEDYEDAAGASDDLASGTGKAADNAKKLKSYLLGIDELNVLEPDKGDSGGSGGGGGAAGGLGAFTEDVSGGQWTKTESIFEKYKSSLDTLEKLGTYISEKLSSSLNRINWDEVYQGARNFGTGLASFLNGLVSPSTFYSVGRTFANSLNTAIYSAISFEKEFDFYEFGESIANGISSFLVNFDFGSALELAGLTFDGLLDALTGFVENIDWSGISDSIETGLSDFIKNHDWGKTLNSAFKLAAAGGKAYQDFNMESLKLLLGIATFASPIKTLIELPKITVPVEDIRAKIKEKWDAGVKYWKEKDPLSEVKAEAYEIIRDKIKERWEESLMYWRSKEVLSQVKTTYESFQTKIKERWDNAVDYWNKTKEALSMVKTSYEDFGSKLKEKWDNALAFWKSKPSLSEIKASYESVKDNLKRLWDEGVNWWKNNAKLPKLNLDFGLSVDSLKKSLNVAIGWINTHIIGALNKLSIKIGPLKDLFGNVIFEQRTIGFNIKPIQGFEAGGFPEPASLFYAGENGVPELLGTVGGRTAVAGGAEITGIADAVYSTGQTEASLLVTAIGILREIAAKDTSVNIGDREIAQANRRGSSILGAQLITDF